MTFFMAGEGRRLYGQTVPSELRDKFAMSIRQPLGVCAVITPWNFPMAIPSWKIIPALVCGNTVVFKPATLTPLSAVNFVKILEEAGVPPGVVNLVTGGGDEVGNALLASATTCASCRSPARPTSAGPSSGAGRAVVQEGPSRDGRQERHHGHGRRQPRAGGRRVPVGRLRHDRPALHGGQPRRRARAGLPARSSSAFVARARALRVGDGLDPATQMGPSVSEGQLETVMRVRARSARRKARGSSCGGHRADRRRLRATGYFHEPTIFADVAPSMRIAQEEIFGPVVSVMPCRSFEEAIEIGNGVAVRAVGVDLHAGRQPGVRRDARPVHRHLLRERADDRRRSAPAVRRHEGHRQRPSRGRHRGARRLFGVEVDLRRFQRPAAARADRYGGDS